MTTAFLALGSNLGDRVAALRRAVRLLMDNPRVRLNPEVDLSCVYETSPSGVVGPQPDYLNCALRIETTRSPRELLDTSLAIEARMGRVRSGGEKAARVIDIDLLLFGEAVVDESDLIIPHPRMHLRRFVLEPLGEIAGDVIHPVLKESIGELAARARRENPQERIRVAVLAPWF